ncbi:MAG: hypothetical protein VYD68_03910, partial [Pseudomonadota bacterium]|nr:hypothetical protein [Pseudomonadota bacterium]
MKLSSGSLLSLSTVCRMQVDLVYPYLWLSQRPADMPPHRAWQGEHFPGRLPHARCTNRAASINPFEQAIYAREDSLCERLVLCPETQIVTGTTAQGSPFLARNRTC